MEKEHSLQTTTFKNILLFVQISTKVGTGVPRYSLFFIYGFAFNENLL